MLLKRTLSYPKFDGMEKISYDEGGSMNWNKFYLNAFQGEKRIPKAIMNKKFESSSVLKTNRVPK